MQSGQEHGESVATRGTGRLRLGLDGEGVEMAHLAGNPGSLVTRDDKGATVA